MGVPAFFKWLSMKYPKIVVDCQEERAGWTDGGEKVEIDTSQPNPNGHEFDNLFLDMNGIIHPASHPEDRPPPETEDDMCASRALGSPSRRAAATKHPHASSELALIPPRCARRYLAIFDYLERVFAAVRPRKLLFMAIDGVAPRAKMNQQRSRRFRAAQEAQEKEEEEERLREEWAAEGREVPPRKAGRPFDSNVITPGTPFMDRLALYLRTFVHKKLSSDPGWKDIKVILSDGSVPGEGEHKIMEYIRSQRHEPGYDPNTQHALHGLDADLIMLSLATHEPHFSILREYVGPTSQRAAQQKGDLATQVEEALKKQAETEANGGAGLDDAPKEATPFQFLHISTLREYLDKEFCRADFSAAGGYQLERVIDDFIFLCFFVGNDFLPHLPSLEIRNGAIDTLCDLYKAIFGTLGGWICEGGTVHLGRAQIFCVELGKLEDELLRRHRVSEDRDKQKRKRRDQEVKGKMLEARHRDMLQKVAATATIPRQSEHLARMRGPAGGPSADGGGASAAEMALGRDAPLLELFDTIKAFSQLPDTAPSQKLPAGMNGFQRAMAHQYCEELGVDNEAKGKEPNRVIHLIKRGEGANESAAARFKRELGELMKTKNLLPEEEVHRDRGWHSISARLAYDGGHFSPQDTVRLGVPGWKQRYYANKFRGYDERGCTEVSEKYIEIRSPRSRLT